MLSIIFFINSCKTKEFGMTLIKKKYHLLSEKSVKTISNKFAEHEKTLIEHSKKQKDIEYEQHIAHISRDDRFDDKDFEDTTTNEIIYELLTQIYTLYETYTEYQNERVYVEIKAIIKNSGIMCINIYPPFLEENPDDATVDSIIKHIDYALSLGAENHLGLGSDFDGIDKTPKGIENLKDYEKLCEKMVKIGYNIDTKTKMEKQKTEMLTNSFFCFVFGNVRLFRLPVFV